MNAAFHTKVYHNRKLQVKVKSCQFLLVISNHLQCIMWSQLLENLLTRQQLCENPLVHKRFLRILINSSNISS